MARIGKSSLVRFAIVSYLISTLALIGYIKIDLHLSAMQDLVIGLISIPTTVYYTFKVLKFRRANIWRALNFSFKSLFRRFLLSTMLIVLLFGYIFYSAWFINETLHEKTGRKTDRIYKTIKRKRPNRSRLNTSKYLR